MSIPMERELRQLIDAEVALRPQHKMLPAICNHYLDHFLGQSAELQAGLKKLLAKYNSRTIAGFLGSRGYPDLSVHVSLWHSIGNLDLYAMLENGSEVYPEDMEVGLLARDTYFPDEGLTDDEVSLNGRFLYLIFYSWLSIHWMEVKGHQAGIVVKTTQNNSMTSWYFNDFQMDEDSKFHLEDNWRDAISKFNVEKIGVPELVANVKKGLRWAPRTTEENQ